MLGDKTGKRLMTVTNLKASFKIFDKMESLEEIKRNLRLQTPVAFVNDVELDADAYLLS